MLMLLSVGVDKNNAEEINNAFKFNVSTPDAFSGIFLSVLNLLQVRVLLMLQVVFKLWGEERLFKVIISHSRSTSQKHKYSSTISTHASKIDLKK